MIVKAKLLLVLRLKFSLAETDDKSDETGSRDAGELVLSLLSLDFAGSKSYRASEDARAAAVAASGIPALTVPRA
jgi:hypothetical protein